jgi:4-amino-4-deoxy-L-arabinose transferase-like glycosyltransferase
MKDKKTIILILIILAAMFLRFYHLGYGDLQTDEAKTALGVDYPHSFLLPSLSWYSQKIIGPSEFGARFPFALLSCLSVLLFYFLGKEIGGKKLGLIFSFLSAFSPIGIILGRSAYLDSSLLVPWLLALIFWIKYDREQKPFYYLMIFLALFIAPFFKIQAVYLYAVFFFQIIFETRFRFWRDKRFVLLIISALPFILYFGTELQQLLDMRNYVSKEVAQSIGGSMLGLLWSSYGFLLVLPVVGCYLSFRKDSSQPKTNRIFLIYSLLILLVLSVTPKRFYYYVMLDLPFVYFSSFVFLAVRKMKWRIMVALLTLINMVFIVYNYNSVSPLFVKDGYGWWQMNEQEVNSVIDENKEGSIVVYDQEASALAFNARWYIGTELKKINLADDYQGSVLALLGEDESKKEEFKQYAEIKDFGKFIIMKKYADKR